MSTVQNKGRIVNVGIFGSYTRRQPGVSFSTDSMTRDEIKALSGKVTTYKYTDTLDLRKWEVVEE